LAVDDRNPAGDMISVEQDTIYRNVDTFCERIVESARDKGAEIVRDNLHFCLHGDPSRWWTFEVPDVDKRTIKRDHSETLDEWTERLKLRFRPRMATAVRENSELSFTVVDVRARVSIKRRAWVL